MDYSDYALRIEQWVACRQIHRECFYWGKFGANKWQEQQTSGKQVACPLPLLFLLQSFPPTTTQNVRHLILRGKHGGGGTAKWLVLLTTSRWECSNDHLGPRASLPWHTLFPHWTVDQWSTWGERTWARTRPKTATVSCGCAIIGPGERGDWWQTGHPQFEGTPPTKAPVAMFLVRAPPGQIQKIKISIV